MAEPLVAFRVTVRSPDEEQAAVILWDCGTRGVELRAASRSGFVDLIAYFEPRPGLPGQLAAALAPVTPAGLEPVPVPDVDWVAQARETFRAVSAGGFRIVPAWDTPPPVPSARTLIVDPGRAFGTGAHETTRLCLDALQELARHSSLGRLLDLGAGSGILAIAALRLGAPSAIAVDLDPEAVASAAHHARLNGVRLGLLLGDGARPFRPAAFDTVVANLSAPLLTAHAAGMLGLLRRSGRLVLSGLLVEDVPGVRAAYSAAGTGRVATAGEWAALVIP